MRTVSLASADSPDEHAPETTAMIPVLSRGAWVCLLALWGCESKIVLNDVHSRLNATRVEEFLQPQSTAQVVEIVRRAKVKNQAISVSGSRHAMGGQQFGRGTIHISTSRMSKVLHFDRERGIIRVEAGIEWPELIEYLIQAQQGAASSWSIVQKQTGADRLSLGGALSANIHGRGVRLRPIIQDVEAFTLVDADARVLRVSRTENAELFGLAIGGYGLFGVITEIELRLMPRLKLERVVEIVTLDDLPERVRQRFGEGFWYGDFQYKTDENATDFMRVGVLSAYRPVPADTVIPDAQQRISRSHWYKLLELAHTDKAGAFELYSRYYLQTDGQVYWSDLHQTSQYAEDYVEYLQKTRPDLPEGSLMICELYVPRDRLEDFVNDVVEAQREHAFNIVYGTMRLIEKDEESFLAWAKQDYACIIFNLRVERSVAGMEKARRDFRKLIDLSLGLDGSFYLTYHRWARKDQILRAYPQFPAFLRLKLQYDPHERFQSDWYRHYRNMFTAPR